MDEYPAPRGYGLVGGLTSPNTDHPVTLLSIDPSKESRIVVIRRSWRLPIEIVDVETPRDHRLRIEVGVLEIIRHRLADKRDVGRDAVVVQARVAFRPDSPVETEFHDRVLGAKRHIWGDWQRRKCMLVWHAPPEILAQNILQERLPDAKTLPIAMHAHPRKVQDIRSCNKVKGDVVPHPERNRGSFIVDNDQEAIRREDVVFDVLSEITPGSLLESTCRHRHERIKQEPSRVLGQMLRIVHSKQFEIPTLSDAGIDARIDLMRDSVNDRRTHLSISSLV